MLDWCDIIFHENALHLDPTSNLGWPDFYQYPFPCLFVKKSLEVGACCWRSKARWVCEGKVLKIMIICFWLALENFPKIWLYLGKLQHLERQIVRPFTTRSSNSNDRRSIWNYFEYVWTDPTFCSYRSQTYQTIILRPNKLQTASMHWRASSERGWYKQLWIFYDQTLFLIPTIQRAAAHWRVFDSICKVSGQTVALVPFLDTISCFALTHQPIVQLPIDREAVLLLELNIYRFKKGAAVIPIASDSHRCAGNAVSWVCMLCNECMRRSWHRWDWLGIESTLVDKHRGIQRAINGALSIHICI